MSRVCELIVSETCPHSATFGESLGIYTSTTQVEWALLPVLHRRATFAERLWSFSRQIAPRSEREYSWCLIGLVAVYSKYQTKKAIEILIEKERFMALSTCAFR